MNLSIKALFCWVKAATGSGEETHIEDLQNGEILLKLVHLLKKSIPSSCHCVDERFKIISNFIKSDCRFNALNGTPIEWEAIKDGRNLSVEIAKVILILVYYDMMNDHCTLKKLDCDVERQIAGLTLTYVEENEGSVSLVPGLDAHLSRRHLTVSHNILEKSATVSTTTSVSSLSSLYDDDESPLFGRSQKVKFLDLQKVASSSVSSSPIQDVMNTPVFQMRRMKRQLMQDRDYIDGLEKELSNKLALLSQRESLINQLQYCLDKLKEDRGVDEQSTRARIDELENKKNMQSCLDDFLKQNKELKNNAAMSDRKVNELAEENGVLTSQMRTVCSRLAISEAEVGKLTEAHESNEAEWQSSISTLQSELCEARAQKELYAEQIEILQGKISCLKDEIDRSTQEEGENMWISVEKQLLESRICTLTEELENATNSLEKIEAEVQAKTQQLKACEREISDQKELLIQKQNQIDQLLESKNEAIDKLQKEMAEMGETLQQEIQALKLRLEEAEKQKQEQATRAQLVKAEEDVQIKENHFALKQDQVEGLLAQVSQFEDEIKRMQGNLQRKEVELFNLKKETLKHEEQLKEDYLKRSEELDYEISRLTLQVKSLHESLNSTAEQLTVKEDLLARKETELSQETDAAQKLKATVDELIVLRQQLQAKEREMITLKDESDEQSNLQQEEIQIMKSQLEDMAKTLRCSEEGKLQIISEQLKSAQEQELLQEQLSQCQIVVKQLENEVGAKEREMALNSEQSKALCLQNEDLQKRLESLASSLEDAQEKMHSKELLLIQHQQEAKQKQENLMLKVEQAEKETLELKVKSSQSQCVESLKSLLEDRSQNAAAKDEQFRGLQLESVQKIEDLKQELVSVAAELNQQKEMNIHILRQKDETIESTQMERDSLIKQKAALDARVLAVEQQLEGAVLENKRLSQAKQAFERENYAALKLQAKLQEELQVLKRDNSILLNEKEKVKDVEEEDLLQQLTAKTTAMEHYKAQMEKAMDHYNSKKELLKKSEGEVANLKHALEVQGSELKNVTLEKKLMQMELERIQSNEKKLLNKIASLEAQQSFADKALCEQNTLLNDHKAQGRRASTLEVAGDRFGIKRSKPQSISSDSLDQSSLDDSLNDTRKLSAPESSTPLVRSSERLAAKRHVLQAESLETLYFTPINTRHRSNTGTKPEASAKRNSASSVKRRRTTQVINITMTKKTPGRNEADETFYSLASARSQPNLSSAHKVSTELFNTPKAAESDQLIGLPGYRRSTIHSQATSTFCVGAENEPDGGPEDWMRIAEIQARNKACLPHLKSSYPLEFDSVRNSALIFTDEELRTGDPIETIRRASVMPGQLQDSLTSHRLSYMGQSANMAPSLSRLSTMPGQVNSTLRSPKGSKRAASTLSLHTTSPEKKTRASCFPRPLTPKNRNVSGPAFPHCQTAPSPADRRQSMMFTIDNTPKKDARKDLLKKGLNKLRNSTRKSPGKSLKSPAQSASRRGQENVPTKAGRPAVGGAGRLGSQKSPQVPNKGQRKSPRGPQRAAKSPGITASARKMMSRMKV
uniref:Nuclear mitotic apparatus protein 1 N-terminal hook domain-containing protein n=1 Tax=Knipowitschia caucasica TaxID=637954 RepID=A0AAV2IY96_KNICA